MPFSVCHRGGKRSSAPRSPRVASTAAATARAAKVEEYARLARPRGSPPKQAIGAWHAAAVRSRQRRSSESGEHPPRGHIGEWPVAVLAPADPNERTAPRSPPGPPRRFCLARFSYRRRLVANGLQAQSLRWTLLVRMLQEAGVPDETLGGAVGGAEEFNRDEKMWQARLPHRLPEGKVRRGWRNLEAVRPASPPGSELACSTTAQSHDSSGTDSSTPKPPKADSFSPPQRSLPGHPPAVGGTAAHARTCLRPALTPMRGSAR